MQVWVGTLTAMSAALVAAAAGPRLARWASGVEVRLPKLTTSGWALVAGFVVGARLGLVVALVAFGTFAVGTAVLVGIDLRLHRLPDRLTLALSATGALLLATAAAVDGAWSSYGRAILGGVAMLVLYLVLFLVVRSGLGAGDVKLAGVLGLHLAWLGWPTLVAGAVAGILAGGVVSVGLLAARRATLATRVPFGPSMVAGAIVAIAIGDASASALLGW